MKRLILYIAGVLFLAGCSTTKHLPEGEILYTGQKTMIVENRSTTPVGEIAMEEVEAALATCWAVPVFVYLSPWDCGYTMDL